MSERRHEFYGRMKTDASTQGIRQQRGERIPIDNRVLMMAEAEYERHFGTTQTIDRLRERGGLAYSEVVALLADALIRYAPDDALIPRSLTRSSSGEPQPTDGGDQ